MSVHASIDEVHIIERARQGDACAFEILVRRYERYVYNLALRVVRDPLDAEDIAQTAFVRAWRGLAGFRGQARFSTWLYRIVTNLCYNQLPHIKRELEILSTDDEADDLPDSTQTVEPGILSLEQKLLLQEALENLPDSYRLLLTLRHLQEMSYEEIAQVTGMPLGTVKTGIFRGRQKLKAALKSVEVEYA